MRQRPGASPRRIACLLRRLERRIGAYRPGRSLWVWSIPVATFVVTFVLCLIVAIIGQLGWWIGVPLALFGAVYMGTTAAVNLTSGMPDAADEDDGGGGGGGGEGPPGGGGGLDADTTVIADDVPRAEAVMAPAPWRGGVGVTPETPERSGRRRS